MSSARDSVGAWELPEEPDISHLVTEDGLPVDNIGSEKQQRLFTECLYSSWKTPGGLEFFAASNVGVFDSLHRPPVVPDVFVSLDVRAPKDWWVKKGRSYFVWEFGKPPDLALEIVSDRDGSELSAKLRRYARLRVLYYVVYDPSKQLSEDVLQCFQLQSGELVLMENATFPLLDLGLVFWDGVFEGSENNWLRFTNAAGELLLTGDERAIAAKAGETAAIERAEAARKQAEVAAEQASEAQKQASEAQKQASEAQKQASDARKEALAAEERAAKLAAKLKALGIDPEE